PKTSSTLHTLAGSPKKMHVQQQFIQCIIQMYNTHILFTHTHTLKQKCSQFVRLAAFSLPWFVFVRVCNYRQNKEEHEVREREIRKKVLDDKMRKRAF